MNIVENYFLRFTSGFAAAIVTVAIGLLAGRPNINALAGSEEEEESDKSLTPPPGGPGGLDFHRSSFTVLQGEQESTYHGLLKSAREDEPHRFRRHLAG